MLFGVRLCVDINHDVKLGKRYVPRGATDECFMCMQSYVQNYINNFQMSKFFHSNDTPDSSTPEQSARGHDTDEYNNLNDDETSNFGENFE